MLAEGLMQFGDFAGILAGLHCRSTKPFWIPTRHQGKPSRLALGNDVVVDKRSAGLAQLIQVRSVDVGIVVADVLRLDLPVFLASR